MRNVIYISLFLLSFQKAEIDLSPKPDRDIIIKHKYYTSAYDCRHNVVSWVFYSLSREQVLASGGERKECFKKDSLLLYCECAPADYLKSGYDRGHLCPAEDMDFSQEAIDETFLMTNIAPQDPKFNRGIWRDLEAEIRSLAIQEEELYIVSGTILGNENRIGTNRLSIPKYYYKAIINKSYSKSWAYLLENKPSSERIFTFKVPIDSLEKLTQIDLFYNLPDNVENKLEK